MNTLVVLDRNDFGDVAPVKDWPCCWKGHGEAPATVAFVLGLSAVAGPPSRLGLFPVCDEHARLVEAGRITGIRQAAEGPELR